tara:strand:+ start:263 stop:367 length:105 start_codon:yes stop_codon:yes gene_type:complete
MVKIKQDLSKTMKDVPSSLVEGEGEIRLMPQIWV